MEAVITPIPVPIPIPISIREASTNVVPRPPDTAERACDESPTPPHGRRRPTPGPRARAVVLGLGALAAAGLSVAVLQLDRDDAVPPAPTPVVDEETRLRELVERGLIPAQTLEPLEEARLRVPRNVR